MPFGWNQVALPVSPPAPASIEWSAQDIVGETVNPFTGQQQTYHWGAAWLEASVMYPPMPDSQVRAWIGFLMGLQGVANVFQMGDPLGKTPRGSALGAPVVAGSNQTGFTLTTTGWVGDQSRVLASGDWIQIGLRLYRMTADAAADHDGNATLAIWPNLRESPNQGSPPLIDTITTHNTKGLFRLKGNIRKFPVQGDRFYRLQFDIREAI